MTYANNTSSFMKKGEMYMKYINRVRYEIHKRIRDYAITQMGKKHISNRLWCMWFRIASYHLRKCIHITY